MGRMIICFFLWHIKKGIKFVWGEGWFVRRLVECILQMVVCQQIGGMYFTDGGRHFTDCFVRVLVCEEDEDKNGPLHRNEMLVFRCSKGINRF